MAMVTHSDDPLQGGIVKDRLDPAMLLGALRAFRDGDFSCRLPNDLVGTAGEIAAAFNDCIDLKQRFCGELERVADAVTQEGRIGTRVRLRGARGGWNACAESVNALIGQLVMPMTSAGRVLAAVSKGDLSQRMPVESDGRPLKGEFLRFSRVINAMVERLSTFAAEVTRVAREVGSEGKLGGQADVQDVTGTWKDLTDSVNTMAGNLTAQVRNIAEVTTAVANGDLSRKITVEARGEIVSLKSTVNTMVDQLNAFASEVTRVAREVGSEGNLGGQAQVSGVSGTWKDLTDSVNFMASNLTAQVRNIAEVTTAVANGDLSKKITVDVRGEIAELKSTINTMVDQLNGFASEVTRVAREVGSEGKLGGQAEVTGVSGTWKDLTDSVNVMAGNLTAQVRNIADVTTAVANGDLSRKITVDVRGEIAELKTTINTMVDQLNGFASEVTRVAREVGSEGRLGGQADVRGVSGTWKDLTDSVNFMAGNLTSQVRNIAEVTTAVAKGDLSKKITVDVRGEMAELKRTVNTMVDQLNAFASEVTRVAREVGSEGRLGGQAEVQGVSGTWKDLTDSVNVMAGNLTSQVRNIAEVTTAVANGDLSKKITVDVRGEIAELKTTINTMVDQLNGFASEVTRVAREVGSEGNLGGQAVVKDVSGTWKDLTDSVNIMAGNLTSQVRNIADVTTAVANGDLSKKITVPVRGEILELKNTINTMVDQLNAFASEVTRVAREVGWDGKLGGQADVKGVSGTWKDLTDSVNAMAGNLTSQVRNIAEVTTAVAKGDLSKKVTVDVRGEILELKDTVNTMVDQLNGFASEVTRVAREVGSEGKLGGQAEVTGVSGTWKDLTDSVNFMAGNLTAQVRNIADVTTAVANGDLSKKITVDVRGEIAELKNTVNIMVDQLNAFASEVTRVAREVGSEGRLGGQAQVQGVSGTWKDLTDSVNMMAANLTSQVRNIAKVTTAVANGDLSKKITVDVRGEILELKDTINTMVDQLNAFASEVTRVAREVGSEGKLGGQAQVSGVSGTWKDLTDSVNFMAGNLTEQVRGIAEVVTAVANGDLKRKLTLQARGEIAQLADTINGMIDTLATFADQVTTVAREVGFEGRLGGQAEVPGAAGLWRDLTDSVNQLAAQLTTQIRAISEVATAVTKGDLSRTIEVEARGEVSELTENVNEMIQNLRDTTHKNTEQDWFKTNLAHFTSMLQGQRDIKVVTQMVMSELAPLLGAQAGVFYVVEMEEGERVLRPAASYAVPRGKRLQGLFFGEGLVGQCAVEKKRIVVNNLPGEYLKLSSSTGSAPFASVVVIPVVFENEVKAVIELASLQRFTEIQQLFLDQLTQSIAVMLNTINASMRTEELLKQSQSLAVELQIQQMELKQANDELQEKARLLQERNAEVERRTREIEEARTELEKRAEQLSLTSKYKSQFLANMSHELRTPLNSLLILSKQLGDNAEGNMTARQVEFAQTIRSAGTDLLTLINDILDLSKVESGTTSVDLQEVSFDAIRSEIGRTFEQVAADKGLGFEIVKDEGVPDSLVTDPIRLQQILKNLLSNAFKFTLEGSVKLRIRLASERPGFAAFDVCDTGIGIAEEKFNVIFEPFQQGDMGTSRQFGGTGLGLAISREIAGLLGGEIRVASTVGKGSILSFLHPLARYQGRRQLQVREPAGAPASAVRTSDLPPLDLQPLDLQPLDLPRLGNSSLENGSAAANAPHVADDRDSIAAEDRVLLVIEDDPTFSNILAGFARERGFKAVVAHGGREAMELMDRFVPDAITLDVGLTDMDGWHLLTWIKQREETAHIPVHVVSGSEEGSRALAGGALAFLQKPATEEALTRAFDRLLGFSQSHEQRVLIVEEDMSQIDGMINLIDRGEISVEAVGSVTAAREALRNGSFDCAIVDVALAGSEALIEEVRNDRRWAGLPIVVYTARALDREQESRLDRLSSAVVVKDGRATERLQDELRFFLRRVESELPAHKRVRPADPATDSLRGCKALVVDDDGRNITALEAALESHGLQVRTAESGRRAIELLHAEPDIDIVLMDIMMPEMDGYETIRHIRADDAIKHVPIVALTAKAMKGDRDACIAAGASEYISKPVDVDRMLSLLRVWLAR